MAAKKKINNCIMSDEEESKMEEPEADSTAAEPEKTPKILPSVDKLQHEISRIETLLQKFGEI